MVSARARRDDNHFYPEWDTEAVLELRRQVWGPSHPHNSVAYYKWLASGSSLDTPQGVLLRRGGEEAVGFASLCVKPLYVDGQALKLAHGLDYMVRPGSADLLQGRTALRIVSTWQALARSRDCSFGITFPNDKSHRLLNSERAGLSPIFGPRLMVRPLASARPRDRLHPRVPRWACKAALRAGALASTVLRTDYSRGTETVEPVTEFGPEFDQLWQEASGQLRVAIIRESRYLNWRYGNHPIYSYDVLSLRRGGELSGYVVTTEKHVMGLNGCLIVDLLVRNWKGSDGVRLVDAVIDSAHGNRLDVVVALCILGGELFQILRRAGFVLVPDRLAPRTFRSAGMEFRPEAAAASDAAAWHFTWSDTDVV